MNDALLNTCKSRCFEQNDNLFKELLTVLMYLFLSDCINNTHQSLSFMLHSTDLSLP